MAANFIGTCINWPRMDVSAPGGLSDMIDSAVEITRRTFLKHINRCELSDIENSLGYSDHPLKGMTMASDWHVQYFRSKLHQKRVYYFTHSAIEHIFR